MTEWSRASPAQGPETVLAPASSFTFFYGETCSGWGQRLVTAAAPASGWVSPPL